MGDPLERTLSLLKRRNARWARTKSNPITHYEQPSIFFPVDALHGTGSDRFFYAILRAPFRKYDFGLFLILIEGKDLWKQLHACLAPYTFLFIENHSPGHIVHLQFIIVVFTFGRQSTP